MALRCFNINDIEHKLKAVDDKVKQHVKSTSHEIATQTHRQSATQAKRELNVVIYGIPECQHGLNKSAQVTEDHNRVKDILLKIDPNLPESSVRDCFRLGSYSHNNGRPRPVLVRLSRSVHVINILSKWSKYPNNVIIKPDLSPKRHKIDKILLSVRWNLIQSGIQRTLIKIRGSSLFVFGKFYGKVASMQFNKSQDLLPS